MRILFSLIILFSISINGFSKNASVNENSTCSDTLNNKKGIYKVNDTLAYKYTWPNELTAHIFGAKLNVSFVKNSFINCYEFPQELVKKRIY